MPPNQSQKAPFNGGEAPPPVPHEGTSHNGVPKLVEVSGFQNVLGMPPVSNPPSTITLLEQGEAEALAEGVGVGVGTTGVGVGVGVGVGTMGVGVGDTVGDGVGEGPGVWRIKPMLSLKLLPGASSKKAVPVGIARKKEPLRIGFSVSKLRPTLTVFVW
jgi:hypothetical protein